ncbi:hypothetical protein K7432_011699 [Basidiobolus ranarum]|uniref:Uncharacterized protein n=1 Tax=Basidiobolus ranarum TaxID=34480 RepID=A0ABR2WLY1_9FUNG
MLSAQYPSNNQSSFTYSNENSLNFKRSFYEEDSFGSRKKRRSQEYSKVESPNPSLFKRSYDEEFTQSDPCLQGPLSSKRGRFGDFESSEKMINQTEPCIVDITSGEVLQQIPSTSPRPCTSNIRSTDQSRALVSHKQPLPIPDENLRILLNIPANFGPYTGLPPSNLDLGAMQLVPYQPSLHYQHNLEQPGHATIYEIQDDDELENNMEIDQ